MEEVPIADCRMTNGKKEVWEYGRLGVWAGKKKTYIQYTTLNKQFSREEEKTNTSSKEVLKNTEID